MSVQPDPKPAPRIKDPDLMAILKLESLECEITGEVDSLHLHHVVFRSQGGDDVRANIVCMVSTLHERYHRRDPEAMNELAWHVYHHRPDTQAYMNTKLGAGAFDRWFTSHTKQMSIEEAL